MNATVLFLSLSAIAFQATSSAPNDPAETVIEVRSPKDEAREVKQVLRDRGLAAVEIRSSNYVLPFVNVEAPSNVDDGEMIIVTATMDKTKLPNGPVQVKYQWTVIQDGLPKQNVLPWPDGSKLVFGAGNKPTTFNVFLDVDCLFGDPKTIDGKPALVEPEIDSPDILVKTITVKGGKPLPAPDIPTPPNPGPGPEPKPPIPQPDPDPTFEKGKYGISKLLYDHLKAYPGLDQSEKHALGQALGTAFESLAGQIAGLEQMRNVPAILAAAKDLNNVAIVESGVAPAKVATLKQQMGDYLFKLYSDGFCVTPDNFHAAASEAAIGLKAIKKP